MQAKLIDLAESIGPPAARRHIRQWPFAIERKLAQVAIRHADHLRCFARRESPQRFLQQRRKQLFAQKLQLPRELVRMPLDPDIRRRYANVVQDTRSPAMRFLVDSSTKSVSRM